MKIQDLLSSPSDPEAEYFTKNQIGPSNPKNQEICLTFKVRDRAKNESI